jgi:hypothetical protein
MFLKMRWLLNGTDHFVFSCEFFSVSANMPYCLCCRNPSFSTSCDDQKICQCRLVGKLILTQKKFHLFSSNNSIQQNLSSPTIHLHNTTWCLDGYCAFMLAMQEYFRHSNMFHWIICNHNSVIEIIKYTEVYSYH